MATAGVAEPSSFSCRHDPDLFLDYLEKVRQDIFKMLKKSPNFTLVLAVFQLYISNVYIIYNMSYTSDALKGSKRRFFNDIDRHTQFQYLSHLQVMMLRGICAHTQSLQSIRCSRTQNTDVVKGLDYKGSLTLAMGKCLCFSIKIKVCQSSRFSPRSYPDPSTLWL